MSPGPSSSSSFSSCSSASSIVGSLLLFLMASRAPLGSAAASFPGVTSLSLERFPLLPFSLPLPHCAAPQKWFFLRSGSSAPLLRSFPGSGCAGGHHLPCPVQLHLPRSVSSSLEAALPLLFLAASRVPMGIGAAWRPPLLRFLPGAVAVAPESLPLHPRPRPLPHSALPSGLCLEAPALALAIPAGIPGADAPLPCPHRPSTARDGRRR